MASPASAPRSRAIPAAAARPCPATSPIAISTWPLGMSAVMYQSPPTRLSCGGGQVADHRPQSGQVERLVVQREDGVLELDRHVPLLGQLGGEPGLDRDPAALTSGCSGIGLRAARHLQAPEVVLLGRAGPGGGHGTSTVSELITVHIRSAVVHLA